MAKFHINYKGEAGECNASSGNCPFGDDEEHFASKESARAAYEKVMSAHPGVLGVLVKEKADPSSLQAKRNHNLMKYFNDSWSESPGAENRDYFSAFSPAYGAITFKETTGKWEAETVSGRSLGKFTDFDSAIKAIASPKPRVRVNAKGDYVFRSPEERISFIKNALASENFIVKVSDKDLSKAFYVAQTGTSNVKLISQAFSSEAQVKNFMRKWNSTDHLHARVEIVHRDDFLKKGADAWLESSAAQLDPKVQ